MILGCLFIEINGGIHMNSELILKMVAPYLSNNQLLFKDFKNLFSFLSHQEQCLVFDVLIANNIVFITDAGIIYNNYEEDANSSIEGIDTEEIISIDEFDDTGDFEILYDENLFKDKKIPESNFVTLYKDVKQSNEILCKLIQEGNEQAKQDLCIKNRALVDKYAWVYGKKYITRLSFDDLEQSGMIGLMKAAERFDITKGYAFSTYAVWWIRQAVVRDIYDTGFLIRLPIHMMDKINKIANLESKYISQGYDNIKCKSLISKQLGLPIEYVEYCLMLKTYYLTTTSLNSPVGEEESLELMEMIPMENGETTEELVIMVKLREDLEDVLKTLTMKEQKVLRLRFGFDDGRARTLEEVGKEFNVTRERIRQIESKALRKLKQPSRLNRIIDYWED